MTNTSLTRRRLLGMGLGSVATAGLFSKPARSAASTQDEINLRENGNFPDSFHRVYSFFDEMMDAYAQGATLRLIQSYSDQQGLLSTGFTYDNAQVIHAYLLRGRKDDIDRARTIGNSLIYAQQNDPISKMGGCARRISSTSLTLTASLFVWRSPHSFSLDAHS